MALLEGYGTFSGTDALIALLFPASPPVYLGECSTITYSILRDVQEVRTMGRITVRGFTRGQRRVAGTIIFTVFEQHVVNEIKGRIDYLRSIGRLKTDELPPFDIVVTTGTEYGRAGRIVIHGAVVFEEGKVISVEDLFTENTWSYMARDITLMEKEPFNTPLPSTVLRPNDRPTSIQFSEFRVAGRG